MIFSKLAAALLTLDTITTLYVNDKTLIYEIGAKDTVIEVDPDGGFSVHQGAGKHKCDDIESVCEHIGISMQPAAPATTPKPAPAAKAKKPATIPKPKPEPAAEPKTPPAEKATTETPATV